MWGERWEKVEGDTLRTTEMNAEIITIGTELLLGEIVDTNSAFLAETLATCGVNVYYKSTVGDNMSRMVNVIKQAWERSDLVITSGGLGPTSDDLTKEAVAAALGLEMVFDDEAWAMVQARYMHRHTKMAANNRRQAMIPKGARLIPNSWGTAPGIIYESGSKAIVCLPGVPRELVGMMQEVVVPFIREKLARQGEIITSRTIRFIGIGESNLEEELSDLIEQQTNPTIALYPGLGEVRVRLTARASSLQAAQDLIAPIEAAIKARAGEFIYGYDDDSLEAVVGRLLLERKLTISVAESCTGGLVSHRLTNVPGSSGYYMQGAVTYSNDAKHEVLGVPYETLQRYGAVSYQTAAAMAEGVRRWAKTDLGVGITGIAGPGGGTATKPVGLVYAAISGPKGTKTQKFHFSGDRLQVKERTSSYVLNMIRLYVLGLDS